MLQKLLPILRPVHTFPNAGFWAKVIFTVGIVGLGFLAVPILAGSAAYAISESFNWKASLNLKFKRAQGFYEVVILVTVIAMFYSLIFLRA